MQHLTLSPSEINIINVVGERMNVTEGMPGADVPGSIYYGITGRSLEPLVCPPLPYFFPACVLLALTDFN